MPTKQMNLRIRDDLDQAVRIQAARLGVQPRDVIEDLIRAAPWSAIGGTAPSDPQEERLPLISPDLDPPAVEHPPAVAPDLSREATANGCPECGGDVLDGVCSDCGYRTGDHD